MKSIKIQNLKLSFNLVPWIPHAINNCFLLHLYHPVFYETVCFPNSLHSTSSTDKEQIYSKHQLFQLFSISTLIAPRVFHWVLQFFSLVKIKFSKSRFHLNRGLGYEIKQYVVEFFVFLLFYFFVIKLFFVDK